MPKASGQKKTRKELIAALHVALRDTSGLGVLFSHAMAERAGINSTDLECLDVILLRGPLTAGALAEATGLTTGAITGVIDRLERSGYARRERDAEDRRKVMVRALPAVEEKLAPLSRPMERTTAAVLQSYGDDELALLLGFLRRAHEAALTAMAELRAMPEASSSKTRKRRGRRS
jgi:DNA-binding MarR family transcriptional regulator